MTNPKKSNNLLENNKCFPWLPWTRQHWHRCICAKRNWCSSGCDIPVRPCLRCTSQTSNSTKTIRLSWSNGFQIFGEYKPAISSLFPIRRHQIVRGTDCLLLFGWPPSNHLFMLDLVYEFNLWAQFNHIMKTNIFISLFNDTHNATKKITIIAILIHIQPPTHTLSHPFSNWKRKKKID